MSPASLPNSQPPSVALIAQIVALRESADDLARTRGKLDAAAALAETSVLIECACNAVGRVHESATGRTFSPGLARAEAFALRELAAARRHEDLATKSPATSRAACELAQRSVIRALDTLIAELIPNTLAPSA